MTERQKPRWRMTYDQLRYLSDAGPTELDRWARLGAFGPRLKEKRDQGWHSHVTREIAQRAVVMSALLKANIVPSVAAQAAATHEVNDYSELLVIDGKHGVTISLDRSELVLP